MAGPHAQAGSFGHSLRGRLVLLFLVAFAPAVLYHFASSWEYRRDALRRSQVDTLAIARLAGRDYEDLIFRLTPPLLRTLAELHPELRARDAARSSALFARMVAEYPQYINIMAARAPSGEVFASGVPSARTMTLADRPYFRRVLQTGHYAVGEFALGKATGKPTLVCAFPVRDAAGVVRAVVAAGVDVERLARQLAGLRPSQELGITLFDRNGTILLATWAHAAWVGRDASGSAVWRAIRGRNAEGVFRGPSMDGVRKIVAFRPLPAPDGSVAAYVAATMPEAAAVAQADQFLLRSGAAFASSAAVALLGLVFIGRSSILRGVNALVAAADRLAEGNLASTVGDTGGTREFAKLAEAFDGMAERLRQRESEQRRAEEALRESRARYQTLVENIDLGITLIDADFRILMANAAHGRLLGKSPSEVAGLPCYRAIHGRDSVCPGCTGVVAMATSRPAVRETGGVRGDGTRLWVRVHAFPVLDADGAARGFIEVVEDLTETKRLRDEREQLERKMLHAQKLESLGVLAGGIAHDFNNLLVGILGNADLGLAKAPPESPARPYLQRIEAAGQRAADLAAQMLAYSGRGRFVVEPVDLSRLVGEMEHLLETVVAKTAAVRYDLAAGLPPVEADATQLRQVVMNLITNASDALGDRPGRITVSTGEESTADRPRRAMLQPGESLSEGPYVYVEVSDTGGGISAAARDRLFDPFFTTKEKGRGLGLAAVLGIVGGHHGALDLQSEPGQGTTFTVYLPAAPRAPSQNVPCDGEVGAGVTPPASRGTVLVVDDEESVRAVARDMLEAEGFMVVTASDGREAVEVFRRHADEIAVVFLDVTMPHMSGPEALDAMRGIRPDVRAILTSGFSEREAVDRSPGDATSAFVQKPYLLATLRAKLAEVLGPGGSGDARPPA